MPGEGSTVQYGSVIGGNSCVVLDVVELNEMLQSFTVHTMLLPSIRLS